MRRGRDKHAAPSWGNRAGFATDGANGDLQMTRILIAIAMTGLAALFAILLNG